MGVNVFFPALFSIGLCLTSVCLGDHFEHPYFAAAQGNWVGDGELTDAEGVVTMIHEDWSGELEENRFVVSGSRQWGDNSQEFRWIFTFNASTELFEAEYWQTGMENEMRFEVSLSETKAEMRSPLGGSGGELLVRNSLADKGIEGFVKFTNGNGDVLLEGSVNHSKRKN